MLKKFYKLRTEVRPTTPFSATLKEKLYVKVVGKDEIFLFDTDTIINIIKPRPSRNLLAKLVNISKNQQYISTI